VRLTFLGTGTSFGVPVVGCDCAVCSSADPRDRRTRHGALVSWGDGATLLVDTPPELRLQLLRARVDRVDAVWFTHGHADHVHGIDDLRIFSLRGAGSVPVYVSARYRDEMEARFRYIFDPDIRPTREAPSPSSSSTRWRRRGTGPSSWADGSSPSPSPTGPSRSWGSGWGTWGTSPTPRPSPPRPSERLEGVRLLVLNALWFGRPHPSHFNVEEAVAMAERVGAELTYLTHLTHRTSHDELERRLPPGVRPAWDGLTVEMDARGVREVPESCPSGCLLPPDPIPI
jgi:phosphoribosyl 1,2-cyclic phosphate phosphodiesterase